MLYSIVKVAVSAVIIVLISEISKRSTLMGSILASLPLVSILAMIWIYVDTKDLQRISEFSTGVFWLVIPSLVLFISLPVLIKKGLNFYFSLGISSVLTVIAYFLMVAALKKFGVKI